MRIINVQENSRAAAKYRIRAVPTFIYFRDGEEMRRTTGVRSADALKAMWRGKSGITW